MSINGIFLEFFLVKKKPNDFNIYFFWKQMQIICKSQKTKKSGPFLLVQFKS